MSVCKTCGRKYSKWTTPVSARGVCRDCFEAELAQEPKAESRMDVAPAPITSAPPLKANADNFGEKAFSQPAAPSDVVVETLAVTLAFFGA
jgi:hypothetical protein